MIVDVRQMKVVCKLEWPSDGPLPLVSVLICVVDLAECSFRLSRLKEESKRGATRHGKE